MRNEWIIYHSNGHELAKVKELEYHGEWMGDEFITVTVKSPKPLEFRYNDYLEYRSQKYYIDYDPNKIHRAKKDSYGEAFVYENVKLYHVSHVLKDVMFKDYVLNDNGMAYSQQAKFSFFAESVEDLADRIEANLDKAFGTNVWKVLTPVYSRSHTRNGISSDDWGDYYNSSILSGIKDVNVSCDGITCKDALKLAYDQFGLSYVIIGNNIIIGGTRGIDLSSSLEYGKGNGLYELEKNTDDTQQVVTKMYAYGSSENMSLNYYANIGKTAVSQINHGTKREIIIGNPELVLWVKKPWNEVKSAFGSSLSVTLEYNGMKVQANVSCDTYTYAKEKDDDKHGLNHETKYLYFWMLESDGDEAVAFYDALENGGLVTITGGANINALPNDMVVGRKDYPALLSIQNLMLPGFPDKSLLQWVLMNGGTNLGNGMATWRGHTAYFSNEVKNPWIKSVNADTIGEREGAVYFDGSSNDVEDIHPTIKDTGADVVYSGTAVTDNGYLAEGTDLSFNMFAVDDSDFDWADAWANASEDIYVNMTSGYCVGRAFKLLSKPKKSGSSWKLTLERAYDSSLQRYFPYQDTAGNYAQVVSGDTFVVTGAQMPQSLVDAASEKLLEEALNALDEMDHPKVTYIPKIDEIEAARERDEKTDGSSLYDTIHAGLRLKFKDTADGADSENAPIVTQYIDTLTIKENGNNGIPTFDVVLRDEKELSLQQRIRNQIESMSGSGSGKSSSGSSSAEEEPKPTGGDTLTPLLFELHKDENGADTVIEPEDWQSAIEEDDEAAEEAGEGYVTPLSIKAKRGTWTNQFLSALGLGTSEGTGLDLEEPLYSINRQPLGPPPTGEGKVGIVWNPDSMQYEWGETGGGGISGLHIMDGNTEILPQESDGSVTYKLSDYFLSLKEGGTIIKDVFINRPTAISDFSAISDNLVLTFGEIKSFFDGKFVTVEFWNNLFKTFNGNTEVLVNTKNPIINNLKILVGTWTEQYLSALGNGTSGGGGMDLNELLQALNNSGLGAHGAANTTVVWNGTSWEFGTTGIDSDAVNTLLYGKKLTIKDGSTQLGSEWNARDGGSIDISGILTAKKWWGSQMSDGEVKGNISDTGHIIPETGGFYHIGTEDGKRYKDIHAEEIWIKGVKITADENGIHVVNSGLYADRHISALGAGTSGSGFDLNRLLNSLNNSSLNPAGQSNKVLVNDNGTWRWEEYGGGSGSIPNIENIPNFDARVYDAALDRAANTFLAGPVSGSNAPAVFRRIDVADLPDLSDTYAATEELGKYLPLTAGSDKPLTDTLYIKTNSNPKIRFQNNRGTILGGIGMDENGTLYRYNSNETSSTKKIWDSSYASHTSDGSGIYADMLDGAHLKDIFGSADYGYFGMDTTNTKQVRLKIGGQSKNLTIGYADKAGELNADVTLWGNAFNGKTNIGSSTTGNAALSYVSSIDATAYFDTVNKYLGVGQSSPQYKLDVNGTIRVGGSSYKNLIGVNNSQYLELGSHGNEIYISGSGTTMHVNRGTSDLSKTIPTDWQWHAGGADTWANFVLGTLEAKMSIKIGGATLKWVEGKGLNINTGFYSDSFISALGEGTSSGGSISLNQPLSGINSAGLGTPNVAGSAIVWNGSSWTYSGNTTLRVSALQSLGSVTSYGSVTSQYGYFITSASYGFKVTGKTNDYILTADGGTKLFKLAIDSASLEDGQALVYDESTSSWVNGEGGTAYTLPLASKSTRGGVKTGYSESNSGSNSTRDYAVKLSSEKMYVNVPWKDENVKVVKADSSSSAISYYPTFYSSVPTANVIGSVYVNNGLKYTYNIGSSSAEGLAMLTLGVSASTTASKKVGKICLVTAWGSGTIESAASTSRTYTLPNKTGTIALVGDAITLATSTVIGGIKIGYTTSGKNYAVQLDSSNNAYVNVPWTDVRNTAGGDDTTGKIFLVGMTSQTTSNGNARTYSNSSCFASGGYLYSGGTKVLTSITSSLVTGALGYTPANSSDLSNYLPKAGGTMTGTLTVKGSQYPDSYSGALNMNNSNIYNVNGIYTCDLADGPSEGINFYRTSTTVDTFWIKNGEMYFTPNRTLGSTATNNVVIHTGNLTTYLVSNFVPLDGTSNMVGNFLPKTSNNSYYLGNSSYRWGYIYATNVNSTNGSFNSVATTYLTANDVEISASGLNASSTWASDNGFVRLKVAGTKHTLGFAVSSSGQGMIQSSTVGTGATSLLINPKGGSVGIGTTTPHKKLHVIGGVRADRPDYNSEGGGFQSVYGSKLASIGCNSSGGVVLASGTIDSNGDASGLTTCAIFSSASSSAYISLRADTRIYSTSNYMYLGSSSNAGWVYLQDCASAANSSNWALRTNGDARFAWVGINGVNTDYRLYVAGNSYFTSTATFNGNIYTSSSNNDLGTSSTRWGYLYTTNVNSTNVSCNALSSSTGFINLLNLGAVSSNNTYNLYVNGTTCFNGDVDITKGKTIYFQHTASGVPEISIGTKSNDQNLYLKGVNLYFNGSIISSSDMRLKDVDELVDGDIESIARAPIFYYRWKKTPEFGPHLGSSAQYWQNVFSCAVVKDEEGYLGLDYSATALASAVITARKVLDHEERIKALEAENERLRNEMEQLKAA